MNRLLGATAMALLLSQCAPECAPEPAVHDAAAVVPGDCDSYDSLFAAYGLPVSTFHAIAWRESRCDHTRFTNDSDDLGGYLLGLNFRTAQLRNGWLSWCGATVSNIRYDADLQVRCAREAYDRLGLSPWR